MGIDRDRRLELIGMIEEPHRFLPIMKGIGAGSFGILKFWYGKFDKLINESNILMNLILSS